MAVHRKEQKIEDTWDLTPMYASFEEWEREAEDAFSKEAKNGWNHLLEKKGSLGDSPKELALFFSQTDSVARGLEKLYTYAHLGHDTDITDEIFKKAYQRAQGALFQFAEDLSWVEPEILAFPEGKFEKYLKHKDLEEYHFNLSKLFKQKPHVLSSKEEGLLALTQNPLQTPGKAFSALNNADIVFKEVTDASGNKKELTHASYAVYLRDKDRVLRKGAFENTYEAYSQYENTLCELLQGVVRTHHVNAQARNYSSCLQAALKPKNISEDVYHNLIKTVKQGISAHHRYNGLRRDLLKLDELHLYDSYASVVPSIVEDYSYEEAFDLVIESVAPLGEEYQNILKKGFESERWVDRYENEGKRSGAYSSGCYDSNPYILMNYKGLLNHVFTLAHEAGHSMHSYYSREAQPYHYGHYSIFVAEVASTFNEELLMRLMLKNAKSNEQKIFLINQKLEDIRGTLFRQTMFAEFELMIHEMIENNQPLTPQDLNMRYAQLLKEYMGEHMHCDDASKVEWARIPHFYYNFYVYQYATGVSAALTLVKRVSNGGNQEREDYLNFLRSGGSSYPLDQLKMAGVDMTSPEPINYTINCFEKLLTELETLTKKSTPHGG